ARVASQSGTPELRAYGLKKAAEVDMSPVRQISRRSNLRRAQAAVEESPAVLNDEDMELLMEEARAEVAEEFNL
ncbi:hypothetical protein KIPB_009501, partial [Kipferlia bialata]